MSVTIRGERYEVPFHRGQVLTGVMRSLFPLYSATDDGRKFCFDCQKFVPVELFEQGPRFNGSNNPRCHPCDERQKREH